jgi:hypothetical protein
MGAVDTSQQVKVRFLLPHPEVQFSIAESRRLCAECWQLRLESLTIYCDLNLTIVAFGHANRDNERIRKRCCLIAVNGYRSIWRMLSRERRAKIQPIALLAKLDQLRTAITSLLGDKVWPTNEAPKIAITTPANRIPIPPTARSPREDSFEDLTSRLIPK